MAHDFRSLAGGILADQTESSSFPTMGTLYLHAAFPLILDTALRLLLLKKQVRQGAYKLQIKT